MQNKFKEIFPGVVYFYPSTKQKTKTIPFIGEKTFVRKVYDVVLHCNINCVCSEDTYNDWHEISGSTWFAFSIFKLLLNNEYFIKIGQDL